MAPTYNDVDAHVSATVRGLAAAQQISHANLATLIGIGTTQFSAKMQHRAPWKLREAAQLADHFGVTLDDLIAGQVHLGGRRQASGERSAT